MNRATVNIAVRYIVTLIEATDTTTMMFLLHIAVNQATSSTVATNIATTIKATDPITIIADLIIIIEMIDP
jgi:hypothetical protein